MRHSVRVNFAKVLMCRTEALGAEVYASSTEQRIVPHTCKSRACPSCGYRATRLWQRQMSGLLFLMCRSPEWFSRCPMYFGPSFRPTATSSDDLPALGAAVIREWAKDAEVGFAP